MEPVAPEVRSTRPDLITWHVCLRCAACPPAEPGFWAGGFFGVRAVPCTAGCFPASLVSTRWMPGVPPGVTPKHISRHCQTSPGRCSDLATMPAVPPLRKPAPEAVSDLPAGPVSLAGSSHQVGVTPAGSPCGVSRPPRGAPRASVQDVHSEGAPRVSS